MAMTLSEYDAFIRELEHKEAQNPRAYKLRVAGLALLALARQTPALEQVALGDVLQDMPEHWAGVTLAQLLEMTSGHYEDAAYMADEAGEELLAFFLASEDDRKLAAALAITPRQDAPWVYHSSDTFLAVRLMQAWLGEDLFGWLVRTVYAPMHLSDAARSAWRTREGFAQHYGGYGSFWLASDVLHLASLLDAHARGERDDVLDVARTRAVLQRTEEAQGVLAAPGLLYHRGFWALEVGPEQGFACAARIAFMSGFGGITVAMLPNGVVFYQFADGGEFLWLEAARELAELGDFCAP